MIKSVDYRVLLLYVLATQGKKTQQQASPLAIKATATDHITESTRVIT